MIAGIQISTNLIGFVDFMLFNIREKYLWFCFLCKYFIDIAFGDLKITNVIQHSMEKGNRVKSSYKTKLI